jgi:hypothetical protein
MDALYKVYERDAFTFVMAISMTGGIMSIITLVFSVLMSTSIDILLLFYSYKKCSGLSTRIKALQFFHRNHKIL